MQIAVTFRHMDSSDPVREYIEEKLARVKKYIEEPIEAQAVLQVEKRSVISLKLCLPPKVLPLRHQLKSTMICMLQLMP